MPSPTLAAAHSVFAVATLAGAAQLCTNVLHAEVVAKWPRIVAALRREAL